MKAKIVKENINPLFKPKSKEEIDLINERLKQQTNEFMTKIFSDLHKDPKDPNIYINSENRRMFRINFDTRDIFMTSLIFNYFRTELKLSENNIKSLIQNWLKENTDWPHFKLY